MKKFNKAVALLFLSLTSFAFAEKITFSANKMSGVAGNKNSITTLKGNAKVNTSMRITFNFQEKISE